MKNLKETAKVNTARRARFAASAAPLQRALKLPLRRVTLLMQSVVEKLSFR